MVFNLSHYENYQTIAAIASLPLFAIFAFYIELLAAIPSVNRFLICILIILNMILVIIFPIIVSFVVESHPITSMYLMMITCVLILKLSSFHHVLHDVRHFQKVHIKRSDEGKLDGASDHSLT